MNNRSAGAPADWLSWKAEPNLVGEGRALVIQLQSPPTRPDWLPVERGGDVAEMPCAEEQSRQQRLTWTWALPGRTNSLVLRTTYTNSCLVQPYVRT